jgi:predicted N-acyltransferase
MSIADFEQLLTLTLVPIEERQILRDGYTTLLRLGWPPNFINCRMCERAYAGLVPRYVDISSWDAYKREWAWADNKR